MIQNIPLGINKSISARDLQTSYSSVLNSFKENANTIFGITNKKDFKAVLMSIEKYQELQEKLNELEYLQDLRIQIMAKKVIEEYRNGDYEVVNNEWLEKMRK